MEIRCDLCGETVVVDDDLAIGQHIRCPFCNGKFAYEVGAGGILTHDLRTALREGRKDPDQERFYRRAPAGARLFIALLFYGRHFRDSLDPEAYTAAFAEIAPELKERDLRYLLQYEEDEEMREYLNDRLYALCGDEPGTGKPACHHANQPSTAAPEALSAKRAGGWKETMALVVGVAAVVLIGIFLLCKILGRP